MVYRHGLIDHYLLFDLFVNEQGVDAGLARTEHLDKLPGLVGLDEVLQLLTLGSPVLDEYQHL